MKHFLFSITIALSSMTTACMEISEKLTPIKLANDETIFVPSSLLYKSTVLHEKQLWKERLNIPYQKPIVVPHITRQQMALFAKAVSVSEDDFSSFYKQLSQTQKAELLNISHESNLDAPGLTILLAQTVLPEDITTSFIYPKTVHLEKIAHYFQTVALQNNIQEKAIRTRLSSSSTIFCDDTGIFKNLPLEQDLHNLKMAYNSSWSDKQDLIIKKDKESLKQKQADTIGQVLCYKKIGNFSYFVTRKNQECVIWQVTNCPDNWVHNNLDNIHVKKSNKLFNCVVYAIFSPNNKYILCTGQAQTKNNLLLKINNSTENFITKELFLPDSLCVSTLPQFNSSSTALALRSLQSEPPAARLIIYNIKTKKKKIISDTISSAIVDTQWSPDGNKLAVIASNCVSLSEIVIYDTMTLNIYNTLQLPSFITHITYTNNKNLVAVTEKGKLYFISENDDYSYNTQLIQNPIKYDTTHSCLIFLPTRNILCCYGPNPAFLMLWDLQTKTYLGEKETNPSSNGLVVFKNTNESYLLTNNGKRSWDKHILWSPEDSAAIEWIKKCPTLYKTYAIHCLYKAHKNGTLLTAKEKEFIFDTIMESFPDDIKQSFEELFFKHPRLTKSILKKGKDLCASLVSLLF